MHLKLDPTLTANMMRDTQVVQPIHVPLPPGNRATRLLVENTTTMRMTQELVNAGHKPLVLDMANKDSAGGGVRTGSNAQEEILCRQSNLIEALEKIERQGGYPFPVTGGIIVPNVQFFRGDPQDQYAFLEQPFTADIFASAAFHQGDRPKNYAEYVEKTKEKMRTMLRIAALRVAANINDSVILSAFGCGAFGNDPELIAQLYKELLEGEFAGQFNVVAFAIANDRNGPTNYQIFKRVFSS